MSRSNLDHSISLAYQELKEVVEDDLILLAKFPETILGLVILEKLLSINVLECLYRLWAAAHGEEINEIKDIQGTHQLLDEHYSLTRQC